MPFRKNCFAANKLSTATNTFVCQKHLFLALTNTFVCQNSAKYINCRVFGLIRQLPHCIWLNPAIAELHCRIMGISAGLSNRLCTIAHFAELPDWNMAKWIARWPKTNSLALARLARSLIREFALRLIGLIRNWVYFLRFMLHVSCFTIFASCFFFTDHLILGKSFDKLRKFLRRARIKI